MYMYVCIHPILCTVSTANLGRVLLIGAEVPKTNDVGPEFTVGCRHHRGL